MNVAFIVRCLPIVFFCKFFIVMHIIKSCCDDEKKIEETVHICLNSCTVHTQINYFLYLVKSYRKWIKITLSNLVWLNNIQKLIFLCAGDGREYSKKMQKQQLEFHIHSIRKNLIMMADRCILSWRISYTNISETMQTRNLKQLVTQHAMLFHVFTIYVTMLWNKVLNLNTTYIRTEKYSWFLLNRTGIRSYLPFFDRFRNKQNSICFQINRKMVNTISFQLIQQKSENIFPCVLKKNTKRSDCRDKFGYH